MITLAVLKIAIRHALEAGDTTEDAYLTQLEAAAVDAVQQETGRRFGATSAASEFVVPGTGTPTLWLPELVSAVSVVKSRAYLGGSETTIATGDADGWALRLAPGETHGAKLIRKGGSLWDAALEYVVTGATGYTTGAEPPLIRQAVIETVATWYGNREAVVVGTVAAKLPHSALSKIGAYRRMVL